MGVPIPTAGSGNPTARTARRRRAKLPSWRLPVEQHADAVQAMMVRLRDDRVAAEEIHEVLHRAVMAEHLRLSTPPNPLFYLPVPRGGRYTPLGGPAALYFAYDAATPLAELKAVVYEEDGRPELGTLHHPVTVFAAPTVAGRVLDLTHWPTRRALDVSLDDLACDWIAEQARYGAGTGPMPATQLIGLAAHETGVFGGVKYKSVRSRVGVNVALFPDRLDAAAGHSIVIHDASAGGYNGRLP